MSRDDMCKCGHCGTWAPRAKPRCACKVAPPQPADPEAAAVCDRLSDGAVQMLHGPGPDERGGDWYVGPQAAALARMGLMQYAEHVDGLRWGGPWRRGYGLTPKGERVRAELRRRVAAEIDALNGRRVAEHGRKAGGR